MPTNEDSTLKDNKTQIHNIKFAISELNTKLQDMQTRLIFKREIN